MRFAFGMSPTRRGNAKPRIVRLSGALDTDAARILEGELMPSDRPFEALDLDLEQVSVISGTAVAVVVHAYFAMHQSGQRLRVIRCSEASLRYLRLCGALELPGFDGIASASPLRSGSAA